MNSEMIKMFFLLLSSAIRGEKISEKEKEKFSSDTLKDLLKSSDKHDLSHLLVAGLKQNGLISKDDRDFEKILLKAIYRYDLMNVEFSKILLALEESGISFIPLKGSVIRRYYSQPWMRTSCDIDILVHREDLEKAISNLSKSLKYIKKEHTAHDVSLYSQSGINVELHFDLVEGGRANNAIEVLNTVWDHATLFQDSKYRYEMSDAFFYFYHIAHMAKHFETGGCGIRPFIDLWILDNCDKSDKEGRNALLLQGGLFKFCENARTLSKMWFGGGESDELSLQMEEFILNGGIYGSSENRVAIHQTKSGGRFGYLMSRVFASKSKLKGYYPILENHLWLLPLMQVRRWFMLLRPDIAKMAKGEMLANKKLDKSKVEQMNAFFDKMGLK